MPEIIYIKLAKNLFRFFKNEVKNQKRSQRGVYEYCIECNPQPKLPSTVNSIFEVVTLPYYLVKGKAHDHDFPFNFL